MAEPTSRIEAATLYRGPEPNGSLNERANHRREKRGPKAKPAVESPEADGLDELDEQEKHSLDTLA